MNTSQSLPMTESHRVLHEYFYDVLTLINEDYPQEKVLQKIAVGACQFEHISGAAIFQRETNASLRLIACAGIKSYENLYLPLNWLWHETASLSEVNSLTEMGRESQLVAALQEVYLAQWAELSSELKTPVLEAFCKTPQMLLVTPFYMNHRINGFFAMCFDPAHQFNTEEYALARAFTKQVELVVNNARLREQAMQDAVKLERNRLGRDLHDSVTQALYTANLMADTLPAVWEHDTNKGLQQLSDIQRMVKLALAEMRSLLVELRPVVLVESSLSDLLNQLANVVSYRSKIPVAVIAHERTRLPKEVQVSFYRIAQEALNNVTKYSNANEAKIELSVHAAGGLLRIRDDGRGFDPSNITGTHMGLRIMRERANEVEADLKIQSQIGGGTTIQVIWDRHAGRDDD
ncbi:MAG: sensor histidine kinase [Chloroflexota bacterium]